MKNYYLNSTISNKTTACVLTIFILICAFFFVQALQRNENTLSQNIQTPLNPTSFQRSNFIYQSPTLHFSIVIPDTIEIEEKYTAIRLKSSGNTISVFRSATNFSTIIDYLSLLEERNNFRLTDRSVVTINNIEAIAGIINHSDGKIERSYFMYADGWIYTLSTDSPALFDDLDSIAQSFRYTP